MEIKKTITQITLIACELCHAGHINIPEEQNCIVSVIAIFPALD